MQTIGDRLEEARKRKGSSIREAAEATKIRGDYLQKFEANAFDLDLPPLYVRGFVRSYARYLELDADRFIAEYDAVVATEGRPGRRETREVYGRVEFGGEPAGNAPAAGGGLNQAMMLKYGLFAGGALLGLGLIFFLVSLLLNRPAAKASTPSQTAAQTSANRPADNAQTVTFTALGDTGIKIVQLPEGRVIADSISLSAGETRSFRKTGTWVVTVRDRTKLRMEVNGSLTQIPVFPPDRDPYGQFKLE